MPGDMSRGGGIAFFAAIMIILSMPEQIEQIAQRIKELREIAGIPAETVAREFNVEPELYCEYESGKVDIPISVLFNIARKFNVELTEILTGGAPRLHEYCLVRKGKGVGVERRKDYSYQSLAYNYAHKQAEPFFVTVPPSPEDAPFPLNSHSGQEFNYVISGALKIIINKHEIVLNEGDSLFFDSKFEHGMKAIGGKPAQFLAIVF
jgi:transcriptional regulator with XRE-family HTH domain